MDRSKGNPVGIGKSEKQNERQNRKILSILGNAAMSYPKLLKNPTSHHCQPVDQGITKLIILILRASGEVR